jgi:pilus assembly protein FimV
MKRVASLAVAVALALGTQQAMALGLGQIQVKSALGQPLLAEIPLRFDSAEEAKSLHLAIASPADYQRAGISTNQMAIPLQFAVVTLPDSGKAIRVTTADPVRDPYIDFLLDAGWANGSLIREYTVLLDPPGFASNAPVTAPRAARLRTTTVPPAATRCTPSPSNTCPSASASTRCCVRCNRKTRRLSSTTTSTNSSAVQSCASRPQPRPARFRPQWRAPRCAGRSRTGRAAPRNLC